MYKLYCSKINNVVGFVMFQDKILILTREKTQGIILLQW